MRQASLSIAVVHEQPLARSGIRLILESSPDLVVVAEAGSQLDAEQALASNRPEVVVLGGGLNAGSISALCQFAASFDSPISTLVLVNENDDAALLSGLAEGASLCVSEHLTPAQLVEAVRRVGVGDVFVDAAATRRVLELLVTKTEAAGTAQSAELSARERDVLQGLADGLTNRQIGERLGLAEKTVKNHVSAVFATLGVKRRAHAAALALGDRASADPEQAQ